MVIYVNGVPDTSGVLTSRDVSSTSAELFVGTRYTLSQFATDLALLRTGGFEPTADQIRRQYDIESQLFEANTGLGVKS